MILIRSHPQPQARMLQLSLGAGFGLQTSQKTPCRAAPPSVPWQKLGRVKTSPLLLDCASTPCPSCGDSSSGRGSWIAPGSDGSMRPRLPPLSSSSTTASSAATTSSGPSSEELIEMMIFNCRFFTLMGIVGSLAGSIICFLKGCFYVLASFQDYFRACWETEGASKVILLLVEAIDIYLMGTVMLIFGMGLYELFVSSLDVSSSGTRRKMSTRGGSNLFGLFTLRERPKWLEIGSLSELKIKLGHVIVMILLVGMFEKSKKVPITSGLDLLCFCFCIMFSSGSLFLLSKLHSS